MPKRLLALLPLAFVLAGCSLYDAARMSAAEKINHAHPLREDVGRARDALFAAVAGDAGARQSVAQDLALQLQARAEACGAGATIARFDDAQEVRRKVAPGPCFDVQDARLADWIGLRRIGVALRMPPLVAPAALPARFSLAHVDTVGIVAAARANVAVAWDTRFQATVLEMPSGRVFAHIDATDMEVADNALSPNGRVLALSRLPRAGLRFHDAATGDVLWHSDRHSRLVAWLPGVEATVLSGRGATLLVDHRKALAEALPRSLHDADWSTPSPDAPARVFLGNSHDVALLEAVREGDGPVSMTSLQHWRLDGAGVTSGQPLLMAQGRKLLFASGLDLGWLDVASGAQGLWPVRAIAAHAYSKLSESRLLLDGNDGTGWDRWPRILDIEQETLAPVPRDISRGLLLPLTPRVGYARRNHTAAIRLATVAPPAGPARPLAQALAEAALARERARAQGR